MHPRLMTFNNRKYEAWIRKKPCLVCGTPLDIQCHHVWHTGSKNGRNSMTSVPLCVRHHTMGNDAYHKLEKERFEDAHSIVLEHAIINYQSEYINQKGGKV